MMIITMILSVMLITMNIRVTRSMKVTMIQIVTFRERRETETPLHHVHMRGQRHKKEGYRALGKHHHYLLPLVPDFCSLTSRMDKERLYPLPFCASHPAFYTSK